MRFRTLQAWLDWQATLNPAEIDLGLDRIQQVLGALGLSDQFHCPLILVAGTNGKGSVVAMLEAIAIAEGLSVGCYSSPHIRHYNERIRIDGENISDEALCDSFQRIDQARGEVKLTYFEFGTLAAIELFQHEELDLVIMEVGLGGRLDAVNVMQPDVSVITTIDIDHTDWLGEDRESIGREKAGIFRAETPAVCGDKNPPKSVFYQAESLGIRCDVYGEDFRAEKELDGWDFASGKLFLSRLPYPSLSGDIQLQNAAVSIAALAHLLGKLTISEQAIRKGLEHIELDGRFQKIHRQPDVFVDVAHNVQAATTLAAQLSETSSRYEQTHAVIAMLEDKDVEKVIEQLQAQVDVWHCAGLDSVPRGLPAKSMASVLERLNTGVKLRAETSVENACISAFHDATADDRIIVFGSFYTVSEAMTYFEKK